MTVINYSKCNLCEKPVDSSKKPNGWICFVGCEFIELTTHASTIGEHIEKGNISSADFCGEKCLVEFIKRINKSKAPYYETAVPDEELNP